ncbi:hypothetical protein [Nonomuraea sp. SYSU D8015]|uniref:hypothetical protein n=1 Tax=Nonomuraea sp. SYSU D8015 TaxID=2593644 RepID=UPI0016616264|nr:hypothetical protein [Nonomuraea sp. SYSU D8015]
MSLDIAKQFARDTANHRLETLHDDGLYRHIRFSAPPSLDWFDLITWPYNLIVNGSHGSYHFCRFGDDTEDMFALFRDGSAGRRINPHYWAEKVRAGEVMTWSEAAFRQWVLQEAAELAPEHPGMMRAVKLQILDSDEHNLEYEETARYAIASFRHKGLRLAFPESWERTFQDFHWQYLWQCHAVVWGIAKYDATKATAREAVPTS